MATSKKVEAKKPVRKPVSAQAAAAPSPEAVQTEIVPTRKRGGRPKGSKNKSTKAPGRKPSTAWLYSLHKTPAKADDDLGLTEAASAPVDVIGPFPSEESAIADALGQIGANSDVEIKLYKDYRTGRPQVTTRLI